MYAVIVCSLFSVCAVPPKAVAEATLTAYMANRESLESRGVIKFRYTIGSSESIDPGDESRIDAIVRGDWKKNLSVDGVYAFDGENRFVSMIHPLDVMTNHRIKISDREWRSEILSFECLSDGKTSLQVMIDPNQDGKSLIYSPSISKGTKNFFFFFRDFPLQLGNREPFDYDMAGSLRKAIDGIGKYRIASASSKDDGTAEITIREEYDKNSHYEYRFVCDLKKGAVPSRTTWNFQYLPKNKSNIMYILCDQIKRFDDRFFPFLVTIVSQDYMNGAKKNAARVFQYEILDANFKDRPDQSLFKIELPEPLSIVDNDRNLTLSARRVWDLKSISSSGLNKARSFVVNAPTTPFPELQGPSKPGYPWWGILIAALGCCLIVTGIVLLIRRSNHG